MKALKKAIKIVGSQAELARQVGVSPQFMNQIISGGRPVPSAMCKKIKKATDGKVMEWDLLPEVFDKPAQQCA